MDRSSEERRKTGTHGRLAGARSYLLKRHTTVFAHRATVAGALALAAISLIGSASAFKVEARASVSAPLVTVPFNNGTVPKMGNHLQAFVARPAVDDNPRHPGRIPQSDQFTAVGELPVPQNALPSHSIPVPPADPPAPAGGKSGANSPAPQANAAVSNRSHIVIGPGLSLMSAHSDSPPHARAAHGNAFALLAAATTKGLLYTGLKSPVVELATTLSMVPDRAARLSSLSLERVLDSQNITAATPVIIVRSGYAVPGFGQTLQRRPDASGLKLPDVHPGATQYLQQGEQPVPLATATPSQAFSKAGLVQPAPTPTGSTAGNWTAANMPGGNARMFRITGYTATGNKTATGTWPHWGTVAVDKRIIPLGSTVYIQGLGIFHAEDTGGAVLGDHIDVFVNSAAEAYQLTGYRLVSFSLPGAQS
jgi:3D (Asp-Asp-Asp) domain-containing protein